MRFHRLFEELADVGEGLDVRHPVHDLHSRETMIVPWRTTFSRAVSPD